MLNKLTNKTVLWRYMTFESFMSLIATKELNFTRLDKLQNIDPYEGAQSKHDFKLLDLILKFLVNHGKEINNPLLANISLLKSSLDKAFIQKNKTIFINCWHMNDFESVAMWDSFTGGKTGIAIKTDFGKLNKSLQTHHKLNYKKVTYDDLHSSFKKIDPFLRKSLYFEHEKELRIFFEYTENTIEKTINIDNASGIEIEIDNPDRIGIQINLDMLIDEIIINPKADSWFIFLVKKILEDYSINISPKNSIIKKNSIKSDNNLSTDITKSEMEEILKEMNIKI